MKSLILCLSIACAIICSCGITRNDLMSSLLNQQKSLKDSIDYYRNTESFFKGKARDIIGSDSLKANALIDSSTAAWSLGRDASEKLKAVDFSIDSLSKMK